MSNGGSTLDLGIVGIVQNAKSEVRQQLPPMFYSHAASPSEPAMFLYVRSTGDPEQSLRAVPAVVSSSIPTCPSRN